MWERGELINRERGELINRIIRYWSLVRGEGCGREES